MPTSLKTRRLWVPVLILSMMAGVASMTGADARPGFSPMIATLAQ